VQLYDHEVIAIILMHTLSIFLSCSPLLYRQHFLLTKLGPISLNQNFYYSQSYFYIHSPVFLIWTHSSAQHFVLHSCFLHTTTSFLIWTHLLAQYFYYTSLVSYIHISLFWSTRLVQCFGYFHLFFSNKVTNSIFLN